MLPHIPVTLNDLKGNWNWYQISEFKGDYQYIQLKKQKQHYTHIQMQVSVLMS